MRLSGFIASSLLAAAAAAQAATNVGVSIGIDQPGVYGRIDIGNLPPPALVVAQPVLIVPQRVVVHQQPVYMVVPPGHQKNWAKHCASYGACAQPVYFVRESWLREQRQHPGKGHGRKGRGKHDD